MKKIIIIQLILLSLISCDECDESNGSDDINFRQEMREFVIGISEYAKSTNANFLIIPQNGVELVTIDSEEDSPIHAFYLNAIDGHGQEDLFYGYVDDDKDTPTEDNLYLRVFLDKSKNEGNTILVTDYCSTHSKMDASYIQNNTAGYVSFAADQRELDNIPNYPEPIYEENDLEVTSLSDIKNFLYLINPENYNSKSDFIDAISSTNYDLLIMDLFFKDDSEFTAAEINELKIKANGGKRLVVSYMSTGEAEDYRYYWQSSWAPNNPAWLDAENPEWAGNFKVKYWEEEWQAIIYGDQDSYLQKIIDAGFDGVYLDLIEAYEYYE